MTRGTVSGMRMLAAAVVAVLLFAALFAPSAPVASAGESDLVLYAWGRGENGEIFAFFTVNASAGSYASVPCTTSSYTTQEEFYRDSHYEVTFDAGEAAAAALAAAPEDLAVTEDNLKIVFVYATMYESIVSNAEKSEQDGVWMHTVTASPDGGEVFFAAVSPGARSENWYALLIGVAAAAIAAAAAVYAAARSVKCRKNRTRPTE